MGIENMEIKFRTINGEQSQFIGEMDKEGKEIYWGDIIESETGKEMVVTFFGGSFVLNGSNMKNTKVIWNSELQHASQKWGKVIGNIWQNPDSIIYLNFKS